MSPSCTRCLKTASPEDYVQIVAGVELRLCHACAVQAGLIVRDTLVGVASNMLEQKAPEAFDMARRAFSAAKAARRAWED